MAFKRALVVDDSKLARVALKKLLEAHDLAVEFAETGEEALDFLDRELVDVVFMDHHMPGMSGLEAVAAIKRNPRTATIPVMMYTTREGEVYVSQARALGAVGVMPKQVQPGVLFEMLVDLGLVTDRRKAEGESGEAARDSVYEVDRRLNDQAIGISVQALVKRILEDQHLSLRADILRGNREFARQVAAEIRHANALEAKAPEASAQDARESASAGGTDDPKRTYSQRTVTLLVLVLLFVSLVSGGLYLQTARERDRALGRLAVQERSLSEELQAAEAVTNDLLSERKAERTTFLEKHLDGLAWSLNEGGSHDFFRPAFDAERSRQLQTLLEHLREVGFRGTLRLSSHLGEFCMTADRLGELVPADPDVETSGCVTIGHPLDNSSFTTERMSQEFQEFLDTRPATPGDILLDVVAHDRFSSTRRYPYPENAVSAGEWNRVAARNHRVEYEFELESDE